MRITKLACCLGIVFAASTCFAQMYTVTDLIPNPEPPECMANYAVDGINASGQVVVNNMAGHYWLCGYRTAPNSRINPATDSIGGDGYGINAAGQVVGWYGLEAFRTAPNSPINPATDLLGNLSYGGFPNWSAAYGINDSGQAVGFAVGPSVSHAFRTAPNHPIDPKTDDLGTLGGTYSSAEAINASGRVVGYSAITGDTTQHAFRTAPNRPINPTTDDLGTLGGTASSAESINAFGQVVGWADLPGDASTHAFRTAPNGRINPTTDDLGTLGGPWSLATGIDDYGQVVGYASLPGDFGYIHAFLYSNGVMHDLNPLISTDSGCQLTPTGGSHTRFGINNAGTIALDANYCNGDWRWHPVLLTPIYKGIVQRPINADGSSVFFAKRGVIPVKFVVTQYGTQPTCTLPATIGIVKAGNGTLAAVDESTYSMSADSGSNFRIDSTACQYVYNLAASAMGVGTYRVDISINGIMVGHAVFVLK
jgi:probable HAF family extracellular repeat protein